MSKELSIRENNSFLSEIESDRQAAEMLMATKHYQTLTKEGIFTIIRMSKALGIDPLIGLNKGFYFLQGKVGMYTELMAALIRRKGHSIIKDSKSTKDICILHGKRADNGDTWTIRYSVDDAKTAGLKKNMYDKIQEIMIYNRAMSMLARQLYPDIIMGMGYTPDEIHEIVDSEKDLKTGDAEVVEEMASVEAIHELLHMIGRTPADYQNKVIDFLNKHGLVDDKIPLGLYNQTHERVSKKLEEMQEELKKETQEEVASE
jgi:hypothetical protein